jgi:phenylalanyl-tRNA synthetase beta chain
MTISYKWLSEYLPEQIEPGKLSKILTSIGLEVEKMEEYEEVKGGLKGLFIGEVLNVEQHPNADKLKLTKVKVGVNLLQIVCGAPNVEVGQKVVVAPVGTTIYPIGNEPLTMKLAKIRGVESQGMICAEDEVGLGSSHAGIMVLAADAEGGARAEDYFNPYNDILFEIGLTPNRMDAMSHWGVSRDVCAYLSHHEKSSVRAILPPVELTTDNNHLGISVVIENPQACKRYSGVCISGLKVGDSPLWMQQRLKAVGVRPINNIVDVTNYILHETGQPLHAFDYDKIRQKKVVVKTLDEGSLFVTLDEKQRKLSAEDLMICDAEGAMCIGGVFGGLNSGVTESTTNIFLESACFDPVYIRKTSFRHGLRTDAAMRFEKGTDISATVNILKRATKLIKEVCGGKIASDVIDVYPDPLPKSEVVLKYQYLKKLSGKIYHPDTIKNILSSLDFTIVKEGVEAMVMQVPYHKPDISLPADVIEEILRIDGLDNIEIPSSITITPSVEEKEREEEVKEKVSNVLTGLGYSEILTNSITNSAYFREDELKHTVKLLNNLSRELDVMRPSMLQTALEVISFNINRKRNNLKFFEFGKTYSTTTVGNYSEREHLCLYVTGDLVEDNWKAKGAKSDFYNMKGVSESLISCLGARVTGYEIINSTELEPAIQAVNGDTILLRFGKVKKSIAAKFDIKQDVYFADFDWMNVLNGSNEKVQIKEISKYPPVERDLAIVVDRTMKYKDVKSEIENIRLKKLKDIRLFDVFESEKIGAGKKSMAVNFTFLDEDKTLTDKEIDGWMNKIMTTLEKQLNAEIRK